MKRAQTTFSQNPELHNVAENGKEWVPFPGGELEGMRPKAGSTPVMCAACRARHQAAPHAAPQRALCFQCYRATLERERALVAARDLDTASEARFQHILPLEPVSRPRLDRLKMERAAARARARMGAGRFVDKRRHAQIAARHALAQIAVGLRTRESQARTAGRGESDVMHAAELQLPEAWLPFVASR